MNEFVAGLAELREIRDHRLIRLDHLAAATAKATATGAATLRCVLRLWRERHGEIGANARKGIERLRLGLVEPTRQRRYGDHERDTNRQAENREDRPALAPHELAPQITEEEHVQPFKQPSLRVTSEFPTAQTRSMTPAASGNIPEHWRSSASSPELPPALAETRRAASVPRR